MDSTIEWFNKEIELYLAIYCADNLETWADKLSMTKYFYNSRLYRGSYIPFELMFGHPTKTHINTPETLSITANNRINHMEKIWTNAKHVMTWQNS